MTYRSDDMETLGSVVVEVRGPGGRHIVSVQKPLSPLGLKRKSIKQMATRSAEVLAAGLDELTAHAVQSMMFKEDAGAPVDEAEGN